MLKKLGIALVVLVLVLVVVVATRPSHYKVERSASISAPAPLVFSYLNDFHHWANWSPWEKLDPGMKKTFSGPPAGRGSVYEWAGNDQVGEGRMTIVDSRPPEQVDIKLEFIKPWASVNQTLFTVKPAGAAASTVTWSMQGEHSFMSKAFSMFMNMDEMVGKDFEKGLASLKELVEADAKKQAAAPSAPGPQTPPGAAPHP